MDQKFFKLEIQGETLKVGFGEPAQNDQIVREVKSSMDEMVKDGTLAGGSVLKINGPASLPVTLVIGHAVAHLYGAVAAYDPKLGKYVVAISHSAQFEVGQLID